MKEEAQKIKFKLDQKVSKETNLKVHKKKAEICKTPSSCIMKNKRIQPVNNRLCTMRINIFLTNKVHFLESSWKNHLALLTAWGRTMYRIMNNIGDFFGQLSESIIFPRVLLNRIFEINIYFVCISFYSRELFYTGNLSDITIWKLKFNAEVSHLVYSPYVCRTNIYQSKDCTGATLKTPNWLYFGKDK